MSNVKKRGEGPVRPSGRDVRFHPVCVNVNAFKIDLDEGSWTAGRLDPDGTFALTSADGLGREATMWTTSPAALRLLARRLDNVAECMEGNL